MHKRQASAKRGAPSKARRLHISGGDTFPHPVGKAFPQQAVSPSLSKLSARKSSTGVSPRSQPHLARRLSFFVAPSHLCFFVPECSTLPAPVLDHVPLRALAPTQISIKRGAAKHLAPWLYHPNTLTPSTTASNSASLGDTTMLGR